MRDAKVQIVNPFENYDLSNVKIALCERSSRRSALLFVLFLFATLHVAAITKGNPPSYPEKGKVVAVRVDEHTEYVPISPPDSKGRTRGGQAFIYRKHVYRVETDDGIYELEGGKEPTMAVSDAVEFRIAKGDARVLEGKKERKYRVIWATTKPDSPQSNLKLFTACQPLPNLAG